MSWTPAFEPTEAAQMAKSYPGCFVVNGKMPGKSGKVGAAHDTRLRLGGKPLGVNRLGSLRGKRYAAPRPRGRRSASQA